MKHILLVENEEQDAKPILESLGDIGYTVERVRYSRKAEQQLRKKHFDAVILDLGIHPYRGYRPTRHDQTDKTRWGRQLCEEISRNYFDLPVIVITKWLREEWRKDYCSKYGAYEFIVKDKRMGTKGILDKIINELGKIEKVVGRSQKFKKEILEIYSKWLTSPPSSSLPPDKRREITTPFQDLRHILLDTEDRNIIILDAGCGNGAFLSMMEGHQEDLKGSLNRIKYFGVDKKERNIKEIESKYKELLEQFESPEFICKPIEEIKYHEEFDFVLCINFLHEINPMNISEVLFNIIRSLKVGGKAEIIDMEELSEGEYDCIPWDSDAIIEIIASIFTEEICEVQLLRYEKKHGLSIPLYSILIKKKEFLDKETYDDELIDAKKIAFRFFKKKYEKTVEEISDIETKLKFLLNVDRSDGKESTNEILNHMNKSMQLKNFSKWMSRWTSNWEE